MKYPRVVRVSAALITMAAVVSSITLGQPHFAPGAPRPTPAPPVGWEEWKQTGQLPNELSLPKGYNHGHQGVVISSPKGFRGGFPGFRVRPNSGAPPRRQLDIVNPDTRSQNSSTYAQTGYIFNVGEKDVIPLYDQLYAIKLNELGLVLSRVTDRIPAQLRPGLMTRTISVAAVGADLFYERHPIYTNRRDLDEVTLEFEKETGKAILKLEPRVSYSDKVPPEGQVPTLPARPPLKLEVVKGEFLTARGRSYKVLNVVPPQDIEGVGHLVGWIELAAEPVEPTPK